MDPKDFRMAAGCLLIAGRPQVISVLILNEGLVVYTLALIMKSMKEKHEYKH